MTSRTLTVLVALVSSGCGSANFFSGTVGGESITVRSAIWHNPADPTPSISLTPGADDCTLLKSQNQTAPALVFILGGTAPGSYPVISETAVNLGESRAGKATGEFYSSQAKKFPLTEGTFTLEAVTPAKQLRGTFTAKAGAEAISGAFEATVCP